MNELKDNKLSERMNRGANTDSWFTIPELNYHYKLSEKTFYRAIKSGKLKAVKPVNKYLIHRNWILAFLMGFGKRLSLSEKKQLEQFDS
jgi:excisionase family DNA binding protein